MTITVQSFIMFLAIVQLILGNVILDIPNS